MAETIRTTLSAVYWTETTDEATTLAETLTGELPAEDRDSVSAAIEFKPEGRPPTYEPEQPPEDGASS
jgi:hypothetical protein